MTDPVDALRSATGRRKVHDAAINVKLPQEVKATLEAIATDKGVTASTVVRWAIADYLKPQLKQE